MQNNFLHHMDIEDFTKFECIKLPRVDVLKRNIETYLIISDEWFPL